MFEFLANAALIVVAAVVLLLLTRATLTPRLHIADFEGQDAELQKGLPRIIQGELEFLRAEGGGTSLRLMTGPDEPLDIPEPLTKMAGPLGIVVQLVQLLPRRVHRVDAYLHKETLRGPALSIRVSRSQLADNATTLYLADYFPEASGGAKKAQQPSPSPDPPATENGEVPEADDTPPNATKVDDSPPDGADQPATKMPSGIANPYHVLGIAASAWLAFRLPRRRQSSTSAMLTDSWESYAQFRIGVAYQLADDPFRARRLYAKSLTFDPLNRGALLNLAFLDMGARCNGPAIDRLRILCEMLPDAPLPHDRLWYRARFNLAAACLNEQLETTGQTECAPAYDAAAQLLFARMALREISRRSQELIDHYKRAGDRAVARTASPELIIFVRQALDMSKIARRIASEVL